MYILMKHTLKFNNKNNNIRKKTKKKEINFKIKNIIGGSDKPELIECKKYENKIKMVRSHGLTICPDKTDPSKYKGFQIPKGCNIITCVSVGKILILGYETEQKIYDYLKDIDFNIDNMYNISQDLNTCQGKIFNEDDYTVDTCSLIEDVNDEIETVNKRELSELEDILQRTSEDPEDDTSELIDDLLNSDLIEFRTHIGGDDVYMTDMYLDFMKMEDRDVNGIICYKAKNEHDEDVNNATVGINEFVHNKDRFSLKEFLELFNYKGTFLLLCCRYYPTEYVLDKESEEVMRVLSNIPLKVSLKKQTHLNCEICNKIITYYVGEELSNRCSRCIHSKLKPKGTKLEQKRKAMVLKKENMMDELFDNYLYLLEIYDKHNDDIMKKEGIVGDNLDKKKNLARAKKKLGSIKGLILHINLLYLDFTKVSKNESRNIIEYKLINRKIDKCHQEITLYLKYLSRIF